MRKALLIKDVVLSWIIRFLFIYDCQKQAAYSIIFGCRVVTPSPFRGRGITHDNQMEDATRYGEVKETKPCVLKT